MKICLVIGSLSTGGAERVAATLANYWSLNGKEVLIVTIAGEKDNFYSVNDEVRCKSLSLAYASRNPVSGALNNFKRVRMLRNILQREKPDITLGFMPTANILCGLASWGTGLIAAGSEHIHPPMMPLSGLWEFLRRRVYARLTFVSALTEESAHWIEENTGARRVPVIPNPIAYPLGIQEPVIEPACLEKKEGSGERWLLAVGRLAEQKGFDLLLAAFGKLGPDYSNWRLIILGEGSLRSRLESYASDLGLDKRVRFMGAVGNIDDWYETSDAYVMTSRFEGFGNTLAEALAYGLPAVAVDCETGPRDILRHEYDGLLVRPNDECALVQALRRLLSDPALRSHFGSNAIEARRRFAVDRIAEMWETQFALHMGSPRGLTGA